MFVLLGDWVVILEGSLKIEFREIPILVGLANLMERYSQKIVNSVDSMEKL